MAAGKAQFRVGDTVSHKKLGKGDILDVYPLGEDTCAVISFEKWGQKKIILKYAALELVSRSKTGAEGKAEAAGKAEKVGVKEVEVVGGDGEEES
ncbi:MAG: hypothetical protein V1694_00290 [Candidatus Eisenbacteria bacterium]